MNLARFRFYGELNDFLPVERRNRQFCYPFTGNPSVKDSIEASGVPHVEVNQIIVNEDTKDFSYRLRDGDSVSVYPVSHLQEVTGSLQPPVNEYRFIADVHLGKLVKYLRLCGFDTVCGKTFNDREIASLAESEKRIVLTRDKGLLKIRNVQNGYWIRSQNPDIQIIEIIRRFGLQEKLQLFTRCLECNSILEETKKESIINSLQPLTREFYNFFKSCPGCRRIYWEGSHYEKMRRKMSDLLQGL